MWVRKDLALVTAGSQASEEAEAHILVYKAKIEERKMTRSVTSFECPESTILTSFLLGVQFCVQRNLRLLSLYDTSYIQGGSAAKSSHCRSLFFEKIFFMQNIFWSHFPPHPISPRSFPLSFPPNFMFFFFKNLSHSKNKEKQHNKHTPNPSRQTNKQTD